MLIWDTHSIPKKLILFWSNWAVFGRQCHFTPRNRLLIDHSGMADAISVQRNEGKCQKRSCPSSPNSNARWGGHCSPPQSAAGTPCYWKSQADIWESVLILFLQVISMRKCGQRALNFSYDFWARASFCFQFYWDTLYFYLLHELHKIGVVHILRNPPYVIL